jgi:4-hydroxy-tetrahydrodipicolinate synthase
MSTLRPAARRLLERVRNAVVPAVLTPMTADGALAEDALERYALAISGSGVAGLGMWAHTGRGPYLSADQRKRVLRTFRATTGLPLIVGVGTRPADDTDAASESVSVYRMAEEAVEGGADALLVFPGGRPGDPDAARARETMRRHARLAQDFDVPLVAFLLHGEAGGFPYSRNLVHDLLAMPHTVGIKLATLDSAMACQEAITLVHESHPDRLAITGEDRMFGASLMWGADGALVGIAAAVPELTTDVTDTWIHGRAEAFLSASGRLDRFASATFRAPMEGYVQRMLWAAEWQGTIPPHASHDPFGPRLPASDRNRVRATLDELGGSC